MTFPDRETVKRLREQFPVGCRIVLDEQDDPYVHIPAGTQEHAWALTTPEM